MPTKTKPRTRTRARQRKRGQEEEGEKKEGEKKEEVKVTIDLDGIGQRIVAMPIKAANYVGLDAGKTGVLFLSEIPDVPSLTEPTMISVSKFDLSTRKTEPFLGGVSAFVVSANGEKSSLPARSRTQRAMVHRGDSRCAQAGRRRAET